MAKKRTGRPPKNADDPTKRDKFVLLRLTASEKSLFIRAARSDGRSMSNWARFILEEAARRQLGE